MTQPPVFNTVEEMVTNLRERVKTNDDMLRSLFERLGKNFVLNIEPCGSKIIEVQMLNDIYFEILILNTRNYQSKEEFLLWAKERITSLEKSRSNHVYVPLCFTLGQVAENVSQSSHLLSIINLEMLIDALTS